MKVLISMGLWKWVGARDWELSMKPRHLRVCLEDLVGPPVGGQRGTSRGAARQLWTHAVHRLRDATRTGRKIPLLEFVVDELLFECAAPSGERLGSLRGELLRLAGEGAERKLASRAP